MYICMYDLYVYTLSCCWFPLVCSECAISAGFQVLRCISEPAAACLAYGEYSSLPPENVVLVDSCLFSVQLLVRMIETIVGKCMYM